MTYKAVKLHYRNPGCVQCDVFWQFTCLLIYRSVPYTMTVGDILTLIALTQRKKALCITAGKWFWGFNEQQISYREISVKSGIFAKKPP